MTTSFIADYSSASFTSFFPAVPAARSITTIASMIMHLASVGACRSRTYADDGLSDASLGPVQVGDGIVKGQDGADVRPQPPVPHPLNDLSQLGTIGLDDEIDR